MYRLLAATTLTALVAIAPAWAQTDTTPAPTTTMDNDSATDRVDDDDDGFDMGWIGLLGLVGLAGLAGRNRRHVNGTTTSRRP